MEKTLTLDKAIEILGLPPLPDVGNDAPPSMRFGHYSIGQLDALIAFCEEHEDEFAPERQFTTLP